MTAASQPGFRDFRAELTRLGFHPSRRLGQNFLVDVDVLKALARESGAQAGDWVLEVGAGSGFLTRELLELGAHVLAVEIDDRLVEYLRRTLLPHAQLELLHADALAGKHELCAELLARLPATDPWRVAANLPYSAASPLLALWARLPNPPRSLSVLVQDEVARRIAAAPGTRDWGPLSVKLQLCYRCSLGRRLAPQLFWPAPEVDSRVVQLELLPERPAPDELAALDRLVDGLFQQRRKTLRAALASWLGQATAAERALALCGLDGRRRAETLELAEVRALGRAIQA